MLSWHRVELSAKLGLHTLVVAGPHENSHSATGDSVWIAVTMERILSGQELIVFRFSRNEVVERLKLGLLIVQGSDA